MRHAKFLAPPISTFTTCQFQPSLNARSRLSSTPNAHPLIHDAERSQATSHEHQGLKPSRRDHHRAQSPHPTSFSRRRTYRPTPLHHHQLTNPHHSHVVTSRRAQLALGIARRLRVHPRPLRLRGHRASLLRHAPQALAPRHLVPPGPASWRCRPRRRLW